MQQVWPVCLLTRLLPFTVPVLGHCCQPDVTLSQPSYPKVRPHGQSQDRIQTAGTYITAQHDPSLSILHTPSAEETAMPESVWRPVHKLAELMLACLPEHPKVREIDHVRDANGDSLKLQLQVVVSHRGGFWEPKADFLQSGKRSEPLSHLQPQDMIWKSF